MNHAKQTAEDVATTEEIRQYLKQVQEERRTKNGGGDEFLTDIN